MGLCASKPVVLDTEDHQNDGFKPQIAAFSDRSGDIQTSNQQQVVEEQIADVVVADAAQQSDDSKQEDPLQSSGASSSAMMILEVKKLLQDLANIQSGSLCVSCTQAAAAIRKHLKGVAHVGIMALTSSPAVCITPGLDGEAFDLLCQRRVVTDAAWAIALTAMNSGSSDSVSTSSGDSSHSGRMYYTAAAGDASPHHQQQQQQQQDDAQLQQDVQQQDVALHDPQQQQQQDGMEPTHPGHWGLMQSEAGMNTLLAVPIRDAAGGVLGLLELASKQHNAFTEDWWDPVLSIICSSLVPLLSCPIASCMKSLMGHLVDVRHDFNTFASTCIQGIAALLEMVTNLHLDVRLGLLSPDSQQVLLLHVNMPHQPPSVCDEDGEPTGEVSSSYFGSQATAIANGRLLAECLDAQQTLLVEAVAAGEPRVLEDTTTPYLEETGVKATDIFVGPENHNTPNSVMVVPLLHPSGGTAFGALYATQSRRGDFCESRVAIECVATGLQALFVQKLVTPPADWSSYLQPQLSTADGTPSSSSSLQRRRSSGSRHDSSTISRRNSSNLSHSSFLGTMVKAIQTDVQQYLDTKKQYETDIQLMRVLGRGGFGTVFEGRWQGCRAAVKVMYVPESLRRLMKCALEMATMATISHPNIVRVYSCLTDMVEETGAVIPGQVSSPRMIRFRPALPEDYDVGDTGEQSPAICNIMVMELCDLGNLRRALEKGLLHKPLMESRRIVVDMELLLEVLLDIARSIQHIHSLNMLHCDIKAENVLLKSSSSSSKQFICKLADFGLMKVMQADKMYLRNMSISGTITHVAPERLEGDSQLTTAVDSYGFGMLMWEVYTCQAPFASLRPAEIVRKVYKGERPAFPANTPAPYQQLAEACWSHNPSLRPSMDVIVQQLQIWRAHLAANPPSS